jgi:hypothetical protein
MTLARAKKAQRQPTSNPLKGGGLRRKPNGPAKQAGPFFARKTFSFYQRKKPEPLLCLLINRFS